MCISEFADKKSANNEGCLSIKELFFYHCKKLLAFFIVTIQSEWKLAFLGRDDKAIIQIRFFSILISAFSLLLGITVFETFPPVFALLIGAPRTSIFEQIKSNPGASIYMIVLCISVVLNSLTYLVHQNKLWILKDHLSWHESTLAVPWKNM